jgi:GNAT superfamily N-acetyltransferase
MSLSWIRETPAYWDEPKARIVGGAPAGVFDSRLAGCAEGDILPGDWWRVEEDGQVVGYGWLDINWGDAEILLATDSDRQRRGVGTFILDHLEAEAWTRGLNYIYNVVRPTHPEREAITAWLERRGFSASEDGRLLRAASRKRAVTPATA